MHRPRQTREIRGQKRRNPLESGYGLADGNFIPNYRHVRSLGLAITPDLTRIYRVLLVVPKALQSGANGYACTAFEHLLPAIRLARRGLLRRFPRSFSR